MKYDWPKKPFYWDEKTNLHISIPFTWNLKDVKMALCNRDFFRDSTIVGGPAVKLMPDYFADLPFVKISQDAPGVLQRINPLATKTTTGCPNRCRFCAVPTTEGKLIELDDWPDLPIICDNNLLAASQKHFDRVCDRLEKHSWCDFNQGLDARLLTHYHAARLAKLPKAIVRLACDNTQNKDIWVTAFNTLLSEGMPKSRIRTYVLIGFQSDPDDAWERCIFIESYGTMAFPQWYHPLDITEYNAVLPCHKEYGWSKKDRDRIMQFYYQHRGKQPNFEGVR